MSILPYPSLCVHIRLSRAMALCGEHSAGCVLLSPSWGREAITGSGLPVRPPSRCVSCLAPEPVLTGDRCCRPRTGTGSGATGIGVRSLFVPEPVLVVELPVSATGAGHVLCHVSVYISAGGLGIMC
jgi:hypothetical protein